MTNDLNGKVALVTGASSGIGRATALAFAGEGATVVVSDIDQVGGEETVALIARGGGAAQFIRADVSQNADVESMIGAIVARYGRLDIAYNNAGIEGRSAPFWETTEENWDRVTGINLKGCFLCMKHELQQMLKQRSGSIVNCSSVAGLVGFPETPAYVASKHGVIGLTKSAALEYATSGIRVNAVCPGVIATPMVDRVTGKAPEAEAAMARMEPMGRIGQSEEVAAAVVWLCSDAASFVTGIAMPVDGGYVAP